MPAGKAQQHIHKVVESMKAMKRNHVDAIHGIEVNFKGLEADARVQFKAFVGKLIEQQQKREAILKTALEKYVTTVIRAVWDQVL